MNTARKKKPNSDSLLTGNFSRKEASKSISEGIRHLFSVNNVGGSSLVPVIEKRITNSRVPRFSWELPFARNPEHLNNSQLRSALIKKIVSDLKIEGKRDLREKVEAVLEELLTNAIYHANRLPEGEEKYSRNSHVCLEEKEEISVAYGQEPSGIFLSVTDCGGKLTFPHVQQAFSRCYGIKGASQIESKEGGAGLGLFLVFEASMHLKIEILPNRQTKISCWISSKNEKSFGDFSFNFYDVE